MNPKDNRADEVDEQLDKILTTLENLVAIDVEQRIVAHKSGQSPKESHAEARQAITALIERREKAARAQAVQAFADEVMKKVEYYDNPNMDFGNKDEAIPLTAVQAVLKEQK